MLQHIDEVGSVPHQSTDLEYRWWKLNKPTYFIDTKDLAHKMYLIGNDIKHNEINLPKHVISFAFPEGTIIDGVKLQPCLFGKFRLTQEWDERTHPLSIMQRHPFPDLTDRLCIEISAPNGSQTLFTMKSDSDIEEALRLGFHVTSEMDQPLTNDETHLMRVLLKICLGFSAYMRAFPDCVHEGFPNSMKLRDLRHHVAGGFDGSNSCSVVTHPRLRGEVSPHWRQSHFRHLRDQRFKRDENGDVRIVFVSESVVRGKGRDINAVEEEQ